MRATPLTETVAPVSAGGVAEWLDVEPDARLSAWAVSATDEVIRYLNRDLLKRQWRLVVNRKVDSLQVAYNRYPDRAFGWVELPYTGLVSVDSVKVDGEAADFEVDDLSQPARVHVQDFGRQLEIVYTAGHDTVPETIITGIKMLAQYLYEHAGACEVSDALIKSGAADILRPYRIEWL